MSGLASLQPASRMSNFEDTQCSLNAWRPIHGQFSCPNLMSLHFLLEESNITVQMK